MKPHEESLSEKAYVAAKFHGLIVPYINKLFDMAIASDEAYLRLLKFMQPDKKDWTPKMETHWHIDEAIIADVPEGTPPKKVPGYGILFKLVSGVFPKGGKVQKRHWERWNRICDLTDCPYTHEEMLKMSPKGKSEEEKEAIMCAAQLLKFHGSSKAKSILLATERPLAEQTTRKSMGGLWDLGRLGGGNLCGRCLMKVRETLRLPPSELEKAVQEARALLKKAHEYGLDEETESEQEEGPPTKRIKTDH